MNQPLTDEQEAELQEVITIARREGMIPEGTYITLRATLGSHEPREIEAVLIQALA